MNAMNIPGFTAEASLYHSNARYQATTDASSVRGLVQPAWGSDTFDPKKPILCLKKVCIPIHRPLENPQIVCWWEGGYINPFTGICT